MRRGPERFAASAPPSEPAFARPAEDRAVIHRLEGELLALAFDQRLDLGERRAGPGREHQLLRLVQRHAGEPGQIERQIGLARAAERALAAAPRDFERLALGQRPAHGVFDVLGVPGFQRVGHVNVHYATDRRTLASEGGEARACPAGYAGAQRRDAGPSARRRYHPDRPAVRAQHRRDARAGPGRDRGLDTDYRWLRSHAARLDDRRAEAGIRDRHARPP